MNFKLTSFLLTVIATANLFGQKKFPKFSYVSLNNKTIENTIFKGKKTIVVLFHIGCPPAFTLLTDLETLKKKLDSNNIQVIGIVQNTRDQLTKFNSTEQNDWSDLRKEMKMNVINIELLPECEIEKSDIKKGDVFEECRKLSKKLKTEASPTLVIVNENGRMLFEHKGYFIGNTAESERMEVLLERIGIK
jgi:peroxiredoxin